MLIQVIDSPCGAGKTTKMMEFMKRYSEDGRNFIYITPFIKERERIAKEIPNVYEPPQLGIGRMINFKNMIRENMNIASTHALFKNCDEEVIDLLNMGHYNLILDEVLDVVEEVNLKKDDLTAIIGQNFAHIDAENYLIWDKDDYQGKYEDIKSLCNTKHVFVIDGVCLMWTFPVEVFKAFDNVFICTYMFDAQIQKYYYDFYNIDYVKLSIEKGELIKYKEAKSNVDKITIYENGKLNNIGEAPNDLSKNWYSKHSKSLAYLEKNMVNFIINISPKVIGKRIRSKDVIWTTFKDYKDKLKAKGYVSGYVACNARATNNYRDRFIVMYTVNRFLNPYIKKFFAGKNVTVDEDLWALSEMIQFIYRSAIRDNKPIYCYIPSSRMRNLLKDYIKNF